MIPISVRSAKLVSHQDGNGEFRLDLGWTSIRELESWPDVLRFFLQGDLPIVWAMYHALTHRVVDCSVLLDGITHPVQARFKAANLPDYTTQSVRNLGAVEMQGQEQIFGLGQRPVGLQYLRMRGEGWEKLVPMAAFSR